MISAVILTKNEKESILECLKTLEFCDEIIIVDDYSTDQTVEFVKKLNNPKIRIIPHSHGDDFSEKRNYGLSKTKGDWVFFVDADERVSLALIFEVSNITRLGEESFNGFYIKRIDVMWGKELKHGETGNIRLLRLAKRDAGEWVGRVHEKWVVRGKTGQLKNPLYHYPHQTIKEFLKGVNFYTSLRSEELYKKGKKTNIVLIIFYPVGKFFINFFLKQGFLDGVPGFIHAITMSFHSFLVRVKLWELLKRK